MPPIQALSILSPESYLDTPFTHLTSSAARPARRSTLVAFALLASAVQAACPGAGAGALAGAGFVHWAVVSLENLSCGGRGRGVGLVMIDRGDGYLIIEGMCRRWNF